ncbi:Stage III sporulation protein AF [Pelotomaculum schinkii]|uniref:Stage III sporulation protein AF n=1 Tax=Pelotomaculum schinkii TaxID=78350 RepID=A0A4Y7RCB3_9FIRM|nr:MULTISPECIES: stage III sporulation protein AF [Pelotomaculum]TEB06655.1 Stage III sporulation protein AF [Pelotomaculum schinkii]TEB17550.1 Stage III sporulation protein AF [Pelotomaculum sp. FP]
MEIIRSLVQNLIVIIILAVLLDMFLPAGEMRKYVKMVMGLLIIVAVVQAVGNLIHWDYAGDFPALTTQGDQGKFTEIMENGKRLTEDQQQKALEEYKNGIARQAMALARANNKVSLLGVEVKVQTEQNKPGYGQLSEMVLTVGPKTESADLQAKGSVIKEVEPVSVKLDPAAPDGWERAGERPPEEAVAGLVATLANFYNLSPEQVKVKYQ